VGLADDLLGHTTQQQSPQPGSAVRPHNDQVAAMVRKRTAEGKSPPQVSQFKERTHRPGLLPRNWTSRDRCQVSSWLSSLPTGFAGRPQPCYALFRPAPQQVRCRMALVSAGSASSRRIASGVG
jgi:hypothetical protein